MTPLRPTRSGRAVAARPLLLVWLVAVISAACIGGEATDDATSAPSASASLPAPSSEAPASPTLQPSPSASASEIATSSPIATASPDDSASPSSAAEGVQACAGTDANRAFFLDAAQNLDWPVYCPVLPARWFVSEGRYSGQGVGQLTIGYKGPNGATLTLQQGGFCETSDGCVPAGSDSGAASLGDQSGTLVTLDDGGYALVVSRAQTPTWVVVGSGLDEPTFREIAAGMVRLD